MSSHVEYMIVYDRGIVLLSEEDEILIRDTWRRYIPPYAKYARLVRRRTEITEKIIDDTSDEYCEHCGHRLFYDGAALCRETDGGVMCAVSPVAVHESR